MNNRGVSGFWDQDLHRDLTSNRPILRGLLVRSRPTAALVLFGGSYRHDLLASLGRRHELPVSHRVLWFHQIPMV
jgi:hypothetical protein